jgi:hypothetical protein
MLKRKPSCSLYKSTKKPKTTPYSPPGTGYGPAKKRFSVLCSVCETTFGCVRQSKCTFSWFYNTQDLVASASNGCHFCNLIIENMRLKGRSTGDTGIELLSKNDQPMAATTNRLKAETRYVANIGVSFLLRHCDAFEHDVLANVDFLFEEKAGKLCSTVYFDTFLTRQLRWDQRIYPRYTHPKRKELESSSPMEQPMLNESLRLQILLNRPSEV